MITAIKRPISKKEKLWTKSVALRAVVMVKTVSPAKGVIVAAVAVLTTKKAKNAVVLPVSLVKRKKVRD